MAGASTGRRWCVARAVATDAGGGPRVGLAEQIAAIAGEWRHRVPSGAVSGFGFARPCALSGASAWCLSTHRSGRLAVISISLRLLSLDRNTGTTAVMVNDAMVRKLTTWAALGAMRCSGQGRGCSPPVLYDYFRRASAGRPFMRTAAFWPRRPFPMARASLAIFR
jgi:hypothetical protein